MCKEILHTSSISNNYTDTTLGFFGEKVFLMFYSVVLLSHNNSKFLLVCTYIRISQYFFKSMALRQLQSLPNLSGLNLFLHCEVKKCNLRSLTFQYSNIHDSALSLIATIQPVKALMLIVSQIFQLNLKC